MFDKAQLRGKSLPASMLLDCKYRNFGWKIQKNDIKKWSNFEPLHLRCFYQSGAY